MEREFLTGISSLVDVFSKKYIAKKRLSMDIPIMRAWLNNQLGMRYAYNSSLNIMLQANNICWTISLAIV